MFREVPRQLDFPAAETEVLGFWDEHQIYEKSLDARRGNESFVFFEGPPTANGLPHPGHCLTRAIKDLFPRYKTMQGYYCERKGGWDTHGLPVEVEVCKELGIHSKEDIEEYGMEPFIKKCQQSVFRYVQEWEDLTRRLGFWVNLEEAYVTYHQTYVESVWWALKTLFDSGLLYQGHKIVWWWAQGGTALSSGEVGQGYREVADPSVFVKMPLIDDDAALLVWTTTPWTLPSNTFCAVHVDLEYARVRDAASGDVLYIAADLVETIANKSKHEFEVISTCKGSELVGKRYRPPFDFYYGDLGEKRAALVDGGEDAVAWRVLAADFVTTDSGTGLVHEAPAFGEVDYELLMAERKRFVDGDAVPLLCAVGPDGKFTDDVSENLRGRWVKEADKDIARDLKERGLLFFLDQYLHDYPFCWRAEEDPLIQYPRRSWFIRTTDFVDDMTTNNQQITWMPEHIRDGRFGKFLESNVDWTLSRERFWGTPLPIWVCDKSGHMEAIGSYEELCGKDGVEGLDVWADAKAADPDLCDDLKVHKPYIDAVSYASPKDPAGRMKRVTEVIDCWFDSGCMPFAQWGYPHQNQDRFQSQFPADFISEALDQTRGWFYSLLAISTMLFGKNGRGKSDGGVTATLPDDWPQPFANCIVLGHLKGEDGLKMSKSKKNYRTPDYIFDNQGTDAMRWLFFSGNPPWTSIMFQDKAISDGQREFLMKLHNVYSFFVTYANIDSWSPSGAFDAAPELTDDFSDLDRWLLSELATTVRDMTAGLDAYDSFGSSRRLNEFVEAMSNWYLRRSRARYWRGGMDADKDAAYQTLYYALVTTSLLAAPFVPFITETLYQNLVRTRSDAADTPLSVHLCRYPAVDPTRIDATLSKEIDVVREIASLGHSVRVAEGLKVKQPLSSVEIVIAERAFCDSLRRHEGVIADELNVEAVEFTSNADEYVQYEVKPNFRSMGPKFGKRAPVIQKALRAHADPAGLWRSIQDDGKVMVVVDGGEVELTGEDVQVSLEAKDGWAAAQGKTAVVVLKTEITEELKRKGLSRELQRHVQTIRKEMDLAFEARIEVQVEAEDPWPGLVDEFRDTLMRETLANRFEATAETDASAVTVEVDGVPLRIRVTEASA